MPDPVEGLISPGNIDLTKRPHVKNPDGSISTVRSIGVNIDGKEVLIPTVVGNRVVSNADAIKEYRRTGQHLGMFDTPEHSDSYAQQLHESEAKKLMPDPQGIPEGWVVIDGHGADTSPSKPLTPSGPEPDTDAGGFRKGLTEGVTGGFKGFVKGLADAPGALVSGIKQMATQSPELTGLQTVQAISRIPAAIRGSATDPEGWGRDVGNLTGQTMIGEAVPGAMRGAVRAGGAAVDVARAVGSPKIAAQLVKHGSTALGAAAGGPAGAILGAGIGEELAARIQARLTPKPAPKGAPPRLTAKAPPLHEVLNVVLDELHKESLKAPVGLETVEPGARATARGEEAATASMRLLKDKPTLVEQFGGTMSQDEAGKLMRAADMTKPKRVKVPASQVVATNEGFNNHLIDQYAVHPGEEIPSAILDPATGKHVLVDGHHHALAQLSNGLTDIELNTHPVDAALLKDPQPRAMWADQFLHKKPEAITFGEPGDVDLTSRLGPTAAQSRMMEGFGRKMPFRLETANPPAPVPLSEAMTAVRAATKEAGIKPTAAETDALVKVVRTGRPASLTVDALKIHQALKDSPSFAGLPTSAEADATIAAQEAASKARSTKPRYGSGQGDYGRQPVEEVATSNPFR